MRMEKVKSWIKAYFLPYKHLQMSKNKWEEQYKTGHWDYLNSLEQLPRFSIIAGTMKYYFGEAAKILDLGCGENVLQKMLQPYKYKLYVGVDISQIAIENASVSEDENTHFLCEDITKYIPKNKFDLIIFNESLYYIKDPKELLRRYRIYLNKGGIFLISMWDYKERNNKIWSMISSDFSTIDQIVINVNKKKSWVIKTIKPI